MTAATMAEAHEANEFLRKTLHIAFGFFIITLRWLPWYVAAAVAALAVLGNWLVLHRIVGRAVARHERGYDAGIVLYPAMVFVLIVLFRERLHLAGIAWAILAFGDGLATVVGKTVPIARLPWNREKSWGGSTAFVVAGCVASFAAVAWLLSPVEAVAMWMLILSATIAAAIAETLPIHVDDNITVPAAAAVTLIVLSLPFSGRLALFEGASIWIAVNTVLATAGLLLRGVDLSGAIAGWLLGTIIIIGAGPTLYIALLAFFIVGTACTKLGYAKKARLGLAQEKGGRRGASHAFSNVGVAAICAIATWRSQSMLPLLMGVSSLVTAAADTVSSEIGQLFGKRAFLPLTFRRVEPGTEGAISLEGTAAGIIAALIVAVVSIRDPRTVVMLTVCGFLASYLESIAGSWNRKQAVPVTNGALNFFNTAAGALLFYIAWHLTI